ncbi:MAG: gamma-glutamylcyclotransferase [Pseudomonadota bacterium]|nr:gamma-glutamylcyclotransferase [Pseudomonadota bacterium]
MNTADGTPPSFLYFAYGSNLLTRRLRERTPSARVVGVGVLRQHALRWHKAATDGSGKCDVVPCPDGSEPEHVLGVVYRIDLVEKPALDAAETLGVGYGEREVSVEMADGAVHRAWAYVALKVDAASVPYDWYHALVLGGAREHAFPAPYLKTLEAVLTKADADASRAARHFGLVQPLHRS